MSKLEQELADGGNAAWICNTVRGAQAVYSALVEKLPGVDIELLHARMPLGWRHNREQAVVSRYGKRAGASRPKRSILVATQIIEQSLDLDFDVMVSDLAPVDLLLQRSGRLHRHQRADRPARLATPRLLWLDPPTDELGVPQLGSHAYVYDELVLLKTWRVLLAIPSISIPEDVTGLIDAVYEESPHDGDEALMAAMEAARRRSDARRQDETMRARRVMIGPPESTELGSDLVTYQDEDADVHETLKAVTRLGTRSISLVCVRQSGTTLATINDDVPLNLEDKPSAGLVKELVKSSVSVSHHALVELFTRLDPPRAWKDVPLLAASRLAVFEEGDLQLDGDDALPVRVKMDKKLGLVIEKTDKGAP